MRQRGFTLIEIIVGIVIITALSIAGSVSYFTLSRAQRQTEERFLAISAVQEGLEQVRAIAQTNFDNLANSAALIAINNVNIPNTNLQRIITVTSPSGTEIRQIQLDIINTVTRATLFTNNFLLSRPPDPLKGNLQGTISIQKSDRTTKPVGAGQEVEITSQEEIGYSGPTSTDDHGFYLFQNLPPGSYTIEVIRSNYKTYTATVFVPSNQTAVHNIVLVLVLPDLGNIKVYVKNSKDNSNIIGATVTATKSNVSKTATYDPNGFYTFVSNKLEQGQWTVRATCAGYDDASSNVTITQDNLEPSCTLGLTPKGNIKVYVKNSKDNSNIIGATVTATRKDYSTYRATYDSTNPSDLFYTFAQGGVFQLSAGTWNVSVTHSSYYSNSSSVVVTQGQEVSCNIALTPLPGPGNIIGSIIDKRISASITNSVTITAAYSTYRYTLTTTSGGYDFRKTDGTFQIAPGTYIITASCLGYDNATYTSVVVSEGQSTTQDIELTPKGNIKGRINTTNSAGDGNISAGDGIVLKSREVYTQSPSANATVNSPSNGDYHFGASQAEHKFSGNSSYTVFAKVLGYDTKNFNATFGDLANTNNSLEQVCDLSLTPMGNIDGYVRNYSNSAGVANVKVTAGGFSATTDSNGYYKFGTKGTQREYQFSSPSNNTNYTLSISSVPTGWRTYNTSPYSSSCSVTVESGKTITASVLSVEETITGEISGKITDTSNNVLKGANITVEMTSTPPSSSTSTKFSATSDANGFYKFSGLEIGTWKLTVSCFGFQKADVSGIQLTALDKVKTINISLNLESKFKISGRVYEKATGNPVLGIVVYAKRNDSTCNSPGSCPTCNNNCSFQATSDSNGNYDFGAVLSPANWQISISASGWSWSGTTLSLTTDQTLDIPLSASYTITITGTVIGSDRTAGISGLPVYLYREGYSKKNSNTSSSGTFTLTETFTDDISEKKYTVCTFNAYTIKSNTKANSTDATALPYCGLDMYLNPTKAFVHGWSSAIFNDSGTVVRTSPWIGNASYDRLALIPTRAGTTLNLGTITLYPFPVVLREGEVTYTDNDGNVHGIEGAEVKYEIKLPNNTTIITETITDSNGDYSFYVPDTSIFTGEKTPSLPNNNFTSSGGSASGDGVPGYLPDGVSAFGTDTTPDDSGNFQPPATTRCGRAKIKVLDAKTNAALSGVNINIGGTYSGLTDNNGECTIPSLPNCIPIGNYNLTATITNYRPYASQGNEWYSKIGTGQIEIKAGCTTEQTIYLWPIGYGNIKGRVRVSNKGLVGATVKLLPYEGSKISIITQSDDLNTVENEAGVFCFGISPYRVLETWPPPLPPGQANLTNTSKKHRLEISHTEYYPTAGDAAKGTNKGNPESIKISVTANETTDAGNIELYEEGI